MCTVIWHVDKLREYNLPSSSIMLCRWVQVRMGGIGVLVDEQAGQCMGGAWVYGGCSILKYHVVSYPS